MSSISPQDRFVELFGGPLRRNEILAPYTTLGAGGKADLFIDVTNTEQLAKAIKLAGELGLKFFVIGGGSNLLVGDRGFRGLIIRNRLMGRKVQGNRLIVGAGEDLDKIVDLAADNSLTGMEFAAGIWGTIGGAIYGNAGAFGSEIGQILCEGEIIDSKGNIRRETGEYFEFTYRSSKLKKTKETVTEAILELNNGDKAEINRRTLEIRQLRKQKHPVDIGSAGCFFKNIEDPQQEYGKLPAGKLLDEVGAKMLSVGDARVFEKHANIIINSGQACAKDIRTLADILKKKVKDKFGLELEEEIISLGDF